MNMSILKVRHITEEIRVYRLKVYKQLYAEVD